MLFTCLPEGAQIPGRFPGPMHARGKWFTIDIHCHVLTPAAEEMVKGAGLENWQPRHQFAERRWFCRRRVHAWGAGGATSAADTIWAGLAGCGAGFEAVSVAGDLVNSRHSRASVGRRSWRCTTISTMP